MSRSGGGGGGGVFALPRRVRRERKVETFFPRSKPCTKKTQKNENESKVRDVYTINGEFGGPPIEVHRGDVLHVTLVNEIPVEYPQVRREERGKRSEKRQRRGKK